MSVRRLFQHMNLYKYVFTQEQEQYLDEQRDADVRYRRQGALRLRLYPDPLPEPRTLPHTEPGSLPRTLPVAEPLPESLPQPGS